MSDVETYRAAVIAAKLAAELLAQHPIAELLRAIDRADAIGPILDPTLYRGKQVAMHEDKCILEAALRLAGFANRRAVSA